MNDQLSPRDQLFLWRLATSGGGDWLKDIKPDLKKDRQRLKKAGLIEEEKRKPATGGHSRPLYITLTDQGWAWLADHLETELPPKASAAELIFWRLLGKLKAHLEGKQLSLAEFLHPSPNGSAVQPLDLGHQIEMAYYHLSKGQPNVRVRLTDLRASLPDVPRDQLDAALLHMTTQGQAALYRLDNPLEIRPEDRQALLRTPSGEERHIIYLGGPGS